MKRLVGLSFFNWSPPENQPPQWDKMKTNSTQGSWPFSSLRRRTAGNSASADRKPISTVLSPPLGSGLHWRHIYHAVFTEWQQVLLWRSNNENLCANSWDLDLMKLMSFRTTLHSWLRKSLIFYHYSQHLYTINKSSLFEPLKLLPNNRQVFFIPWVTRLSLIILKCELRHTQLLTSIPWAVNRESLLFAHLINTHWCHLWLAWGCFDSH